MCFLSVFHIKMFLPLVAERDFIFLRMKGTITERAFDNMNFILEATNVPQPIFPILLKTENSFCSISTQNLSTQILITNFLKQSFL